MNILIVEDEAGIREGLASFLRLKGLRVRTADGVGVACELLEIEAFDAVVSDWRLGAEVAAPILARAECPCLVVSGYPGEVGEHPSLAKVLPKPLAPDVLLREIRQLGGGEPAAAARPEPLPIDTQDRVDLVRCLLEEGTEEICDDGQVVVVCGVLSDPGASRAFLDAIGGDLRVLERSGRPFLELRLHRDGRPEGIARTIGPEDPWPDPPEPVAVDLHLAPAPCPQRFLRCVEKANTALVAGREVHLLNVPSHLRFFVEALGRGDQLPKRPLSGPRLPEVLAELWR